MQPEFKSMWREGALTSVTPWKLSHRIPPAIVNECRALALAKRCASNLGRNLMLWRSEELMSSHAYLAACVAERGARKLLDDPIHEIGR